MNSFEELSVKVSHNIDGKEQRIRSRTEQERVRFNYAVTIKAMQKCCCNNKKPYSCCWKWHCEY